MTDAPIADAKPGHNAPDGQPTLLPMLDSLPTVDDLIAQLMATHAGALARVEEIESKGAKYFTITSDEEDAKATEFLVPIRTRFKTSEADRVATKTRFDDLAGAVQGFFKSRILDKLAAAPSNKNEEFDPVTSDQYGVGVRITMAQTLYKRAKAAREKALREAEAARLRKIEDDARAKREADAAERKRVADAEAKAAREKADAEAKARKEAADKAAKEAQDLADAAARKRSVANKAAADAAAAAAKMIADKAAADQAEADRVAKADQEERDRIAQQEREEREAADRAEENRIAEQRSAAEESASASTADLSRSRGAKGGVSSLKEFISVRDVDREELDYMAIGPYFADKAVASALDGYQKANKAAVNTGIKTGKQPVKGAIFFLNTKSGGRS